MGRRRVIGARRFVIPGLVVCGFLVPLFVLGVWLRLILMAPPVPTYVVRLTLPPREGQVGLPPILGPADASRPLVVIDAGHGGHDPGASAADSPDKPVFEKNLTLALALALRDRLLADGRVRVALTRSDDRFLALAERAGMAQRLHADLFLSLHADAAADPEAGGATVYTLSDKGSDAVADALAARENRVDTVNGIALGGRSGAVATFLVDLSQRAMRERSVAFADLIRREGEGRLRFHVNAEREAAFVVLKSLDLPSALLEAGYVSNAQDRQAMANPGWRRGFAQAVASAIAIALARQEQGGPIPVSTASPAP